MSGTALIAGMVALIVGIIAGYFIGKPQPVQQAGGILGTIQSITGIKL